MVFRYDLEIRLIKKGQDLPDENKDLSLSTSESEGNGNGSSKSEENSDESENGSDNSSESENSSTKTPISGHNTSNETLNNDRRVFCYIDQPNGWGNADTLYKMDPNDNKRFARPRSE